jgi:hypothetical protein
MAEVQVLRPSLLCVSTSCLLHACLQVSLLQQSEACKLQAARLSASQQLEAGLKLQQQSAQQQLQQETQQLQDSWSERCALAEAAAAKQQALKAYAESEVSR